MAVGTVEVHGTLVVFERGFGFGFAVFLLLVNLVCTTGWSRVLATANRGFDNIDRSRRR